MLATPTATPNFKSRQVEGAESALQTIGTPVVLMALLLLFSHLQDYVSALHLPLILLTICLMTATMSGGLYRTLVESRTGRYLTALTVFFAISVVFSVWRGGSYGIFTGLWLKSYGIYIVVAALLTTMTKVVRAMWFSVIGMFWTALSALFLGRIDQGRLSTEDGRFGDPNDLAQILIIGTCLACALLCRKKTGWWGRGTMIVALCAMWVAGAKTGSRGGFIGALIVAAVLFFQSSVAGKVRMVLACLMLTFLAITLIPRGILNRYLSVLGDDSAQQELTSAESGSAESRKYLLTQSLYVTAQHPLTGVGLGMFANAEDTAAKSQGMLHGSWHETHNMYTQVSSEAGLPALFCFIAAFVYGFKNVNFVCRAAKSSQDPVIQDAGTFAFWMRLALIGLASTGFFLSVAYAPEPMILLAMTVALQRAVRVKMATAPVTALGRTQVRVASVPAALPRNVQFSSTAVTNGAMSEVAEKTPSFATNRKSRG